VLRIHRIHTSSCHPESNGVAESWHRTLHTGLSHLVNHSHRDWDLQLPFFIVYRATSHTNTGYSPFYLQHGREMSLPGNDNLKSKVATNGRDIDQRIESLKASLRSAFRSAKWANKKSHQRNKKYHDRLAKHREFEVNLVCLYQPARRPGLSAKFFRPWTGPLQVTAKISNLNYEIQDRKAKRQIVHINRLKAAHDSSLWRPINEGNRSRKPISKPPVTIESGEEAALLTRPIPFNTGGSNRRPQTVCPDPCCASTRTTSSGHPWI